MTVPQENRRVRKMERELGYDDDWETPTPPSDRGFKVIDIEDGLVDGVIVDEDEYQNWIDDMYCEAEAEGYHLVVDGVIAEFWEDTDNGERLVDRFEFCEV